MTAAVTSVGISDVFMTPLNILFGLVHGGLRTATGAGAAAKSTGSISSAAFAKTSNIVAGEGAKLTGTGAILSDSYAATRGQGIKLGSQEMLKTISGMGARGSIVAAVVGLGAVIGIAAAFKIARHAQNILAEDSRGNKVDWISNSGFHFARLLSAIGMGTGCILTVLPGGAALGVPLALVSAGTSATMGIARKVAGANVINYPEMAGWPLNLVARSVNEPMI